MVALIYLCRHVSGKPKSDDGKETDAAAYLSLNDMDSLDEPINPWCEWYGKRVLRGDYHLIPIETDNPKRPKTAFF